MDWRKYFTPSEFVVEKINTRHDKRGLFDVKHGWQLLGFEHAGVSPAVAGGTAVDYTTLLRAQQDAVTRKALVTVINRGTGDGRKASLSDIAAVVSQATGTLQGKSLSKSVGESVARLQASGDIKVNRVERRMKFDGTHWTYMDPTTKKVITNPITGKAAKGSEIPAGKAKEIAIQTVHELSLTKKGLGAIPRSEAKGYELSQSLSNSRPTKFEPVKGSYAEKALAIRRETFPSSQLAPQGRVHANEKNAPELLKTSVDKIDPAQRKKGEKTLGETYPTLKWYDATSSARANVGAMTGNQAMLDSVRLGKDGKVTPTPAMKAAADIGIKHTDKPYYAILHPTTANPDSTKPLTPLTKKDFNIGGLLSKKDAEGELSGVKKVVKAVDTPRLYGARSTGTIKGTTDMILTQAGYDSKKGKPAPVEDRIKAKILAEKLVNNFEHTPIYQFEQKFKSLAKEMPDNFVYTNPVSGFRMGFQKHNMTLTRLELKDQDNKAFAVSVRTPGEPSSLKSRNSAMPLFVQSMDAAVKDIVTVEMKNPYTKHDAFAVKSNAEVTKLKKVVASAYQRIHDANPINDLAAQMKKQLEKQIGKSVRAGGTKNRPKYKIYSLDDYNKQVIKINNAVNAFPGFSNNRPPSITIPDNTGHLEYEK